MKQSQGSNQLLIVLSGPSGVGKDALLKKMKEQKYPFHYVVTVTSRPRRKGERDGVDYHFISQQEFQQMIDNEELLEWANVYGNYYGVPKREISQALSKGMDVIVKVDVQGAATIRRISPQTVFIFLRPPSMEELELRLRQRHTESARDLAVRLRKAEEEMNSLPLFDHVLTSHQGKLDEVISQVQAIVTAEKRRVKPGAVEL